MRARSGKDCKGKCPAWTQVEEQFSSSASMWESVCFTTDTRGVTCLLKPAVSSPVPLPILLALVPMGFHSPPVH